MHYANAGILEAHTHPMATAMIISARLSRRDADAGGLRRNENAA